MRENKRMTSYHIEIFQPSDEAASRFATHYAHAFGDLDTIAYVAKKASAAIADVKGNITLALNEVDAIGGQATREVVAVTANAKVVATVLRGELTAERKAAKSAPAEQIPDGETDSQEVDPNAGGTEFGKLADVQTDANDPQY